MTHTIERSASPAQPVSFQLQRLGIFLAAMARVANRNARLSRWYVGNRLRQCTVRAEYLLRADGYSAPPRSISFRPTFLCNARCKMCSYANSIDPANSQAITRQQEMIDLDTARRLVDAIAPSHTLLAITGGEPFVWGDRLFELLAYCRHKGVATSVTTNGTFLDRYLDQLLATPPDVMIFSLLGPEETHNTIVGLPVFAKIRESLQELFARRGHDRWELPMLVTNSAVLPENCRNLAEIVRISHELGAFAANFQPVWLATEAMHTAQEEEQQGYDRRFTACHQVEPAQMRPDVVWQEMLRAQRVASMLGHIAYFYPRLHERDMETYYRQPDRLIGRSRALCAHLVCQVLPDGSVSPCLGHLAGNLHEQNFLEIWNGPAMRDFRLRLKQARAFPICSRCCVFWRNE